MASKPPFLKRKGTLIGLAIGGVGVAGYLVYREQAKSKAAAAAAATSAQQSASYGYGYGQAYGYGQGTYPGGYYGYGEPDSYYGYGSSSGASAPGYGGYYGYGVPVGSQGTPAVTTNAQWAQAAINQLTSEGYDPMTVSATLGAYELGQPIPAGNENIVQAAIGIEGDPPQAGANGYPPAINVQGTTGGGTGGGQGGGGTGGGGTGGGGTGGGGTGGGGTGGGGTGGPPPVGLPGNVPSVVGMRYAKASTTLKAAGFNVMAYDQTSNTPAHIPFGRTGTVTSQNPPGGGKAAKGSTVNVHLKISGGPLIPA